MDKNPFTLVFGKSPEQFISRGTQLREITEVFCEERGVMRFTLPLFEDYILENYEDRS